MRRTAPLPWLSLAVGSGLLVALSTLAVLQYRWITRASDAERDRLRASLDTSAARFCDAADAELARVYRAFQFPEGAISGDLETVLGTRLATWRKEAPVPGLVREILVVSRPARDVVEIRRFDEVRGRLVETSTEPELDSLRRIFESRAKVPALDERLPGILLPVRAAPPPEEAGPPPGRRRPEPRDDASDEPKRPPERRPADPDRPPRDEAGPVNRRPPRDHVVVRLDVRVLAETTLARLAEREFGGLGGLAFGVTVSFTVPPRDVIFRGGPLSGAGEAGDGDVTRTFFSMPRPGDAPEPGGWTLSVHHPSGSLEGAVSGARRRNLAVSLAILALLGLTVVLLVTSTQKARRLARQQMDFVASVSHELKTPLTAMRSAGQNLADGIVSDPEKVKRYGALIEREGRRLTEMVARVLTFAGLQSGASSLQRQPVSAATLVDDVLSDFRFVLEERGVKVEKSVAQGLPPLLGDAAALRQALANLVDNAVKYGGPSRWVRIDARLDGPPRGEEVVLSVSDHGPGIRKNEQRHIFEPFFRGTDTGGAGGTGLGLSVVRGIVEAHGGHVFVESTPGKGSRFTIRLPAGGGKGGQA